MNWKWLFVSLFFVWILTYSFSTVVIQSNSLLAQSALQCSTDVYSTVKVNKLTKSAPIFSWQESVMREVDINHSQTGSYVHATKNSSLDGFFASAFRITTAYDQIKNRIFPTNIDSKVSLIGKASDQTVEDTRNYFQLLGEIMDSVWNCRSAWTTVSGLENHLHNDFNKIFELFEPENVCLYKKIKPKLLTFEIRLHLVEYFDKVVINLMQMSNECISKYSDQQIGFLPDWNWIRRNLKSYDVITILEKGSLKYYPKLTEKARLWKT